jgi:oligoendopeptidase F
MRELEATAEHSVRSPAKPHTQREENVMATTAPNLQKLPTRDEIPADRKWRLEDMFATDDDWETEFNGIKELLKQVDQYKGRLAENAAVLLGALELQDTIYEKLGRIYAYARMREDEDTANPRYQELSSRAQTLYSQVSSALAFMNPEILAIPAEQLAKFMADNPKLQIYRHALDDLQRQKAHILPPAEEEILARFSEIAQGPANIFGMLNDADIKFPTIKGEDGQEIEVTKGRFLRFMESRDRRVRADAFHAFYQTYAKQKNTLAATLHASVKKDCLYAQLRRYESALHAALDDDNIPISVYDNLIRVIRDNMDLMHRYVALRRKLLGVDELHMYDLYAPLVPDVEFKIGYDEARDIVLTTVSPLGDEYKAKLENGLNSSWIDVYENRGKASGAYSWGVYGAHPYILLNWQDTLDNVYTLAHEIGHAMHSYFSCAAQPFVYSHYSIFLAEIASTLNENLLTHHLLNELTDKQQRMYVINHHLDQFRGTMYRQTMFAEFERITHAKVEAGEPLTVENLSAIYRGLLQDYFGPDIVLDPEIDLEWARIPHFYRAFYVYKYATGFAAATALYRQIIADGEDAVQRYLRFLSAGSHDYPLAILQTAGVDMSRPEPVEEALQVFASLLDEMEQLA